VVVLVAGCGCVLLAVATSVNQQQAQPTSHQRQPPAQFAQESSFVESNRGIQSVAGSSIVEAKPVRVS
jgi:hypothetical protein